jgi:hypothetical protein
MAVEEYGREKGYPSLEKVLDEQGRVTTTHRDRYQIIMTTEEEVGNDILFQLPFNMGGAMPDAGMEGSFIKSMKLDRSKEVRRRWFLDLIIGPLSPQQQEDADENIPPEFKRPHWYWGYETIQRAVTKDVEGKAIVNSVQQVIELVNDFVIPVLNIDRLEPIFYPSTIMNYVNHTNSDEFLGAPAGSALMAGIGDREDPKVLWQGIHYRRVSYVVKFAVPYIEDIQEGWLDLLADAGTFYIDTDTGNPVHFKAGSDNVTGNLNYDGTKKDQGEPPGILRFKRFKDAAFNELNFDLPF